MNGLVSFLVLVQALGAAIGTYGALTGELAYIRALGDGKVSDGERAHLHALARGLRFGMSLLLLASFGLVVAMYTEAALVQPALTSAYWEMLALALLIIYVSYALSRRTISFELGSAIAFTGWWFLLYLTFGNLPPLTMGAAIAFFVVATGVMYAVLYYLRHLARHSK